MKIKRTLLPGQAGTKQWLKKYGTDLICVRYRYDEQRQRKITTVEIMVGNAVWERKPHKIPANKRMPIRVDYGEIHLGKLVKSAGGRWNRRHKVWELAYKDVIALGLEERIVAKSNSGHSEEQKPP